MCRSSLRTLLPLCGEEQARCAPPGTGVDEIGSVALEIARQIRNQYTIAYAPLNQALDGTYRAIRVSVSGPERLSVLTRAGYRATPRLQPK